jgi:hypothetical protein
LDPVPSPDAERSHRQLRTVQRLALEGSGNPRAASLKNCGTDDHDQPQSGKEGEGAKSCNHHIHPSSKR